MTSVWKVQPSAPWPAPCFGLSPGDLHVFSLSVTHQSHSAKQPDCRFVRVPFCFALVKYVFVRYQRFWALLTQSWRPSSGHTVSLQGKGRCVWAWTAARPLLGAVSLDGFSALTGGKSGYGLPASRSNLFSEHGLYCMFSDPSIFPQQFSCWLKKRIYVFDSSWQVELW